MRNTVFRLYYLARVFVCIVWVCAAAAGIWWSLRLARADALFRRNTPDSVSQAVRLAPGNIAYRTLQGLQIEYAGGDPARVWQEMARRRPTDASFWIQLGLREEAQGRFAGAERNLLQAAQVNAQYEPRWTLANFYFRRGLKAEFDQWAEAAMQRMYDDPRPLFALGGQMGEYSLKVPPGLRGAYVQWLVEQRALPEAIAVADALRPAEDRESILGVTESLMGGKPDAAFKIWSRLGFTPSPDFQPLLARGFDWRIAAVDGIRSTPTEEPSLRIVFDGKQPESVEIFSRVFLNAGTGWFRLKWQSRTSTSQGWPGFSWRLGNTAAAIAASESWRDGELVFPAPTDSVVRLALRYERAPGSARFDGTLWIRHVMLEANPQ